MANDPKNPFAWNLKKSSGQTAFTEDSYKVASTGGGTAMSKENPNEELPTMDGVESLFSKGASGLASTLLTGMFGGEGKLTYSELKAWNLDNPNLSFGDAGPSLSYQVDFSKGTLDRVVGNGKTMGESVKDVLSFGFLPVGKGLGDFFGGIAVAKNTDYPLSIRSQAAFDAGSNSFSLPAAALMVGGVKYGGNTVSVYRKMSTTEAAETIRTMRLQPTIPSGNSSKYLSESLGKVEAFQNKAALKNNTEEVILQFNLDKKGYNNLMNKSVNQLDSKGVDAIKYNFEGINSSIGMRNLGVPASQLESFNSVIKNIKYIVN